MKSWQDSQEDAVKVRPDKETAKSILKMIEVRERALELKDRKEFTSLVVEDYYEIIKEAITALMAADGYKTLSHEELRNKIVYKGFFVEYDFLERNETGIKEVVAKLKLILKEKLAEERDDENEV